MSKKNAISLFDCMNARYPAQGQFITCAKGHKLANGYVNKRQADREDSLICRVCQFCLDYSPFETPWERAVSFGNEVKIGYEITMDGASKI